MTFREHFKQGSCQSHVLRWSDISISFMDSNALKPNHLHIAVIVNTLQWIMNVGVRRPRKHSATENSSGLVNMMM